MQITHAQQVQEQALTMVANGQATCQQLRALVSESAYRIEMGDKSVSTADIAAAAALENALCRIESARQAMSPAPAGASAAFVEKAAALKALLGFQADLRRTGVQRGQ